MLKRLRNNQGGFTLIEMVVALGVFAIIAISILGLYTALVSSTIIMKQKSIALSLATNQIEYVKSLPYSGLAVQGGSIYSTNPIPSTETKKVNNVTYTVKTSINHVDDAFDGCGSYPNATLKTKYCRNLPSPSGSPSVDTNPQDYKVVHITVLSKNGARLAELDTQIAARVAETASTTGALFVSVIDGNGNPISGANVNVRNTTTSPVTDLNDSTDSNGVAIFYGLQPDTSGFDYVATATKDGHSSLNTIGPSGSLQPTYPNVQLFTQQSSYVTLTIKPQGENSLLVESTDTNGAALSGVRVYAKGGYKSYTLSTNTAYYYNNLTPTDTRPTTDASGLATMRNLVPGNFIFCGDNGAGDDTATRCLKGSTVQYLVAAVPYSGTNSLNPITIPTQTSPGDPGTSFILGTDSYLQKVRLMFSTSSTFPRVSTLKPDNLSLASTPLTNFSFQVAGVNLPCSSTASSCGTVVRLAAASGTIYTASCTGNTNPATLLTCRVNLTGVQAGMLQLRVTRTASNETLNLPITPMLGGLNVLP